MTFKESLHWHVRHYGYRWEELKVSFKKNKLAWFILFFFAGHILIAGLATTYFFLTQLGLLSHAFIFFGKCYVIYVLIFAVLVSPFIIIMLVMNKIARTP